MQAGTLMVHTFLAFFSTMGYSRPEINDCFPGNVGDRRGQRRGRRTEISSCLYHGRAGNGGNLRSRRVQMFRGSRRWKVPALLRRSSRNSPKHAKGEQPTWHADDIQTARVAPNCAPAPCIMSWDFILKTCIYEHALHAPGDVRAPEEEGEVVFRRRERSCTGRGGRGGVH